MDKITNEHVLDAVVRRGDIFYTEENTGEGIKSTVYIALPIPRHNSYILGLQLFDINNLDVLDDCDFVSQSRYGSTCCIE